MKLPISKSVSTFAIPSSYTHLLTCRSDDESQRVYYDTIPESGVCRSLLTELKGNLQRTTGVCEISTQHTPLVKQWAL